MFLCFEHVNFRFRPFPIALARPVMPPDQYAKYVAAYPSIDLFASYTAMGKQGMKFTLSEKESPKQYKDFVQGSPIWREFHRWIKSDDFIYGTLDMLRARGIDLGYEHISSRRRMARQLKAAFGGRWSHRFDRLSARFEFSALPADGGNVVPHTDAPDKIVTMVVSMAAPGEWLPEYGGGLDINRPKDEKLDFNQMNSLSRFEDMEVVGTFDFQENQAVIFVKTFNSWHSVRPMSGVGSTALRRTLTIVIEAGT
jgi:hypothetical protein